MAWVRCCGGSIKKPKFLYKDGTMYVNFTGYAIHPSWSSNNKLIPTITNSGGTLNVSLSANGDGTVCTDAVDLTDINTIRVHVVSTGYTSNNQYFMTLLGVNDNYTAAASVTGGFTGNYTLNVSSLSGNYRFAIFLINSGGTRTLSIDEIELME